MKRRSHKTTKPRWETQKYGKKDTTGRKKLAGFDGNDARENRHPHERSNQWPGQAQRPPDPRLAAETQFAYLDVE